MPTPKPRVAFFSMTLRAGHGGISRVARMIARFLAQGVREGRFEAQAWSLLDTEAPADLELPVHLCGGSRVRFAWECLKATTSFTHFVYDAVGIARAHPRFPFFRRPSLVFMMGIEVWENASPRGIASAHRASALVAISDHTRTRANAAHGGFNRARVCWLATAEDDPAPPHPPAPPRVLTVSRIDEGYKGLDLLIDAWPAVLSVVPEARLTFVGRGQGLEALRARAAASSAAGQIEILGFVPESELQDLYANSAIFALPSRGEGFGLVYIEAMRHGLPVLATVHDAGQEVNLDGVTGYNVDLTRAGDLTRRLQELLVNPERAVQMGEAGRRRWSEQFRYTAFEARFATLFAEYLATGKL